MATWKKVIVSGSRAEFADASGSFSGSFVGDGSGLTGVTADGTLSSSAQIASDISGALSVTALNAVSPGIISGAAQLPSGTVSGSAQTIANLPSGTVSGSAQTVENLPSGTISGSAQLPSGIVSSSAQTVANLPSGTISGSAQLPAGTVSGSAQTIANLPAGTVSGSAQVNADSITNFDTNVDARLDAKNVISSSTQIDGDFLNTTGDDVLSGSAQIASDISGSLSNTAIAALGAGILSGSAQLPDGLVSSSAQTIANLPSGTVSGSAQTVENLPSGTISGSAQLPGGIVSGSAQTIANLPSGTVSGSAQTIANLPSGVVSGSGQLSDILPSGTVSGSAQTIENLPAGTVSGSAQLPAGLVSASAEGSNQGQIDLNGVAVDINDLGTGDSPTFVNLTLTGDLEVQGTTTTIDSETLVVQDNIIALNGTAAAKGGLAVNDATAPNTNSGSLLWDSAQDYWIAGPTGSETKVFVAGATGDGLVSGSGQIPDLLPSGVVSGSAQTVANLPSGTVSGSAQTIANLPSGTVSGSAQTIANLPSGTISGSSQLDNTRLDLTDASGSFSGSFVGDGSGLTGVTADGTLSSSAQIADDISGSLSKSALNTVSAGIVSSSTQTVANLLNQATDFGTGRVSGDDFGDSDGSSTFTGSFNGDGSLLTNITVDQNATVSASFSNATTRSISHNFDSDNVIVVAYDDQDEQFIPSTIKAVDSNTIELHFSEVTSGRAIVARGGHIVSGSIPFDNIINKPTLVSGSAQLASDISGSLSNTAIAALGAGIVSGSSQIGNGIVSSSAQTIANLPSGTVSGSAQTVANLPAGTVSGSSQVNADSIVNFDTNVVAGLPSGTVSGSAQTIANLPSGTISGSSQLDNTRLDLTDASGSFSGSFVGDGSGLTGVTADGTLSSSAQIADDISGSLSNTAIAALGAGIVSASVLESTGQGEARLVTNDVNGSTIDLGLQTTDSPTFAGLTVNGDLLVTGDTIESQVTNLNIADKYILLNSGSTSGDSGIIFGGADGTANQGVGLFWDNGYNSNDGRLAVVNSIAAGATADQTPAYHIAAVFEGTEANAATAQADHAGNIRVESNEIYIYV